jgi:DNA-binding transcriptional MocR family regulator
MPPRTVSQPPPAHRRGGFAPAPLVRSADATLVEQLAARYAERVRAGLIAPGSRLPSVRDGAARHGVGVATVVAAYDRLQAAGLVEARPHRGFFVRGAEREPVLGGAAAADGAGASRRRLPVSATALIRAMFQPPGAPLMPGSGTLPAEWLDAPLLAAALRRATTPRRVAETALQYGDPAGEPSLRQALAARLAACGIVASPEQIVTTVGATHALDVVTRTLLRAGDRVLVDDPGWSVEFARLEALGMRLLPVPRLADGPDVAAMRRLIEAQRPEERPRLYVTVSVLHNPTGGSLSPRVAHQVLQLAEAHDFRIAEDDTYAHCAPAHATRLSALDGLARTVYLSGFSKILAPNFRVGFLAAAPSLVDRLIDTKLLTTLTTPSTAELAIAHCLEAGSLRRHAERVMQRLAEARARTVRLAEAHGFRLLAEPAGLFAWVDAGVDTERLAQAMLDHWLLAPGALFHAPRRPTTAMRVNVAAGGDARFWKAAAAERKRLNAGGGARSTAG